MKNQITVESVDETSPIVFPKQLGFGKLFTDRMFTQRFTEKKGWHDARITGYKSITLDPACTVFHNGQMIFDGTKAYRSKDGHINLYLLMIIESSPLVRHHY